MTRGGTVAAAYYTTRMIRDMLRHVKTRLNIERMMRPQEIALGSRCGAACTSEKPAAFAVAASKAGAPHERQPR